MVRWVRGWVVVAGLGLACGPTVALDDTGDGSSSTTSGLPTTTTGMATLPPETTTGTTGTTVMLDDTTVGPDDEWGGFDDGLFIADNPNDCDLYLQNCVQGYKCVPWADDGGEIWNTNDCVPIVEDPDEVGDPCTREGGLFNSLDTCGWGSICWDVDPATGEGTCVAFCQGTPWEPACADPQTYCYDVESPPLCMPWCDPLVQSCPAGEVCVPLTLDFECAPDASGAMGAPGDPCVFINECDPGNFCATAMFVPGCAAGSCCTPFCDLNDPMPPCLAGQVCMPWYEPGMGPAHHDDVGGCVLP